MFIYNIALKCKEGTFIVQVEANDELHARSQIYIKYPLCRIHQIKCITENIIYVNNVIHIDFKQKRRIA